MSILCKPGFWTNCFNLIVRLVGNCEAVMGGDCKRSRRMMTGYRVGRRNTEDRPDRRSEDIMQELRTQGSVQAVMEVHQDLFLYQAGVYTNTNTGPVLGHHAVR